MLDAEGASGELTLTFVDVADMAELNAEHMGKDGPTDVLSFPLDDAMTRSPAMIRPGAALLGDVVISPAWRSRQFADHAGTFDDEIALLVVHGILHVLGHDHAEPDEAEAMRARELEHARRTALARSAACRVPPDARLIASVAAHGDLSRTARSRWSPAHRRASARRSPPRSRVAAPR